MEMKKNNYLMFSLIIILTCSNKSIESKIPDQESYFPLLSGSYWVYQLSISHEPQPSEIESLYVKSSQETDSGFFAEVDVFWSVDSTSSTWAYRVNKKGVVFLKLRNGKTWKPVAHINPVIGDTIPTIEDQGNVLVFNSTCSETDSSCLRAENFQFENAPANVNLESWHGILLKKGIGKVYQGGSETGWNLIRYRIGQKGEVKSYVYD